MSELTPEQRAKRNIRNDKKFCNRVERTLRIMYPNRDPLKIFTELYMIMPYRALAEHLGLRLNMVGRYGKIRGVKKRPFRSITEMEKALVGTKGSRPPEKLELLHRKYGVWWKVADHLGVTLGQLRRYRRSIGCVQPMRVQKGDWIKKYREVMGCDPPLPPTQRTSQTPQTGSKVP